MKKLYKNEENKVFLGILSGIGDYLEMDPTFIRVVFIFVSFVTGFIPGFLFYFICFFIIPDNPINSETKGKDENIEVNEESNLKEENFQ